MFCEGCTHPNHTSLVRQHTRVPTCACANHCRPQIRPWPNTSTRPCPNDETDNNRTRTASNAFVCLFEVHDACTGCGSMIFDGASCFAFGPGRRLRGHRLDRLRSQTWQVCPSVRGHRLQEFVHATAANTHNNRPRINAEGCAPSRLLHTLRLPVCAGPRWPPWRVRAPPPSDVGRKGEGQRGGHKKKIVRNHDRLVFRFSLSRLLRGTEGRTAPPCTAAV